MMAPMWALLITAACQVYTTTAIDEDEAMFSPPEEVEDTGTFESDEDGAVAGAGTGQREVLITRWGEGEVCHAWYCVAAHALDPDCADNRDCAEGDECRDGLCATRP